MKEIPCRQMHHLKYDVKNVTSFPSHKAHRAALISVSLALRKTPVYTARPRIWGHVTVYIPASAGTHFD